MRRALIMLVLCAAASLPMKAQQTATDWAWQPLLTHEGVVFTYLFYREADNTNNGVVIKIANTNDYPVAYRFKVVFRAEDAVKVEAVEGQLNAREVVTGDTAGLFWVPFTDGRTISEIGLRGFKIIRF